MHVGGDRRERLEHRLGLRCLPALDAVGEQVAALGDERDRRHRADQRVVRRARRARRLEDLERARAALPLGARAQGGERGGELRRVVSHQQVCGLHRVGHAVESTSGGGTIPDEAIRAAGLNRGRRKRIPGDPPAAQLPSLDHAGGAELDADVPVEVGAKGADAMLGQRCEWSPASGGRSRCPRRRRSARRAAPSARAGLEAGVVGAVVSDLEHVERRRDRGASPRTRRRR